MTIHVYRLPWAVVALFLCSLLFIKGSYAFPSLTDHPHDSASIQWEKDGSKDGSSAHNHRSNRSFRGFADDGEPYSAYSCWDNKTYRLDTTGDFDHGHCFIDEASGNKTSPTYYFKGTNWPNDAKARIRDAFAVWSAATSDKANLLIGVEFSETNTEANAHIKLLWTNLADNGSCGGSWNFVDKTQSFDSTFDTGHGAWSFSKDPTGLGDNDWHFYSVALHEIGHIVGLAHQVDTRDDLMAPTVGEPKNFDCDGNGITRIFFTGIDADSTEGVRDLYSQPHRRIAFVIDDTGSMGDEIGGVKVTVNQKVDEFVAKNLKLDYHLLTYKDSVFYRGHTTDPGTIKGWVNGLSASGGGDCPEEMLGALNQLATEAPHSEAWLMTDAGFHGGIGDVATTIFNLVKARVKVHFIVYSWCFDSVAAASKTSTQGDETTTNDQVTAASAQISDIATATGVGPQSFAQIANETGGHYFQITSSETQAASTILLNEMVMNADLTKQTSTVTSGSPKIYNIAIDSSTKEANFLLTGFSGNVNLLLKRPNGATVNQSDPDVKYIAISSIKYYQISTPAVGVWQAQVSGDGAFAFSSSGNSEISFAYLSDTSLVKGKSVTLLASLSGPIGTAEFQFMHPDGALLEKVTMFDDGVHGDGSANDGTYAGIYTPKAAGSFRFGVRGTTTGGVTFERIATEIIRVQTLNITAPNSTFIAAGGSVTYDFAISNGSPVADTFEIAVSSSQNWADISSVPATLNIPSGQTVHIMVPVNVPAGTPDGILDETIVAAVSQTDPLVNDTASVFTTVSSAPACVQFSLRFTGAQEVPPTPSKVIGTGVVRVETATNTLSYQITVKNLPTAETGAHIHGFAPAGSNAGILYQLPLGAFKTGKLTYTEAQEANILAGQTYVNVHTRQYPNGEVRAQIANGVACPTTVLAAEADALEATVGATEDETTDEGSVDETVEMLYHLYLPVINSNDATAAE